MDTHFLEHLDHTAVVSLEQTAASGSSALGSVVDVDSVPLVTPVHSTFRTSFRESSERDEYDYPNNMNQISTIRVAPECDVRKQKEIQGDHKVASFRKHPYYQIGRGNPRPGPGALIQLLFDRRKG